MNTSIPHPADSPPIFASELSEQTALHSLGTRPAAEVLHDFLLAALTLTLVLATMGNLGIRALAFGPILAVILVVGRALAIGANAVDDTQT